MQVDNIPLSEIAASTTEFGWKILFLIRDEQNISFKEIREKIGISQEKIYKEISKLEGALLISTFRDPKDQRSNLFILTEYGKKLIEKFSK